MKQKLKSGQRVLIKTTWYLPAQKFIGQTGEITHITPGQVHDAVWVRLKGQSRDIVFSNDELEVKDES